eukprot:364891-Chlamydomonas_euryale.AAC.2
MDGDLQAGEAVCRQNELFCWQQSQSHKVAATKSYRVTKQGLIYQSICLSASTGQWSSCGVDCCNFKRAGWTVAILSVRSLGATHSARHWLSVPTGMKASPLVVWLCLLKVATR